MTDESTTTPNGKKRRRLMSQFVEPVKWDWEGDPIPRSSHPRRLLSHGLDGPVYGHDDTFVGEVIASAAVSCLHR